MVVFLFLLYDSWTKFDRKLITILVIDVVLRFDLDFGFVLGFVLGLDVGPDSGLVDVFGKCV